jgi:putative transposase
LTTSTENAVLTDKDTLKEVIDCLTEHISIDTQGAFNQTDLLNIIVGTASQADTIENTASKFKKSCSGQNIRYHLAKFKSFQQLETQLNLALISRLPGRIKKRNLKLAIDLNLIPYYGKPSKQEQDYIYRSQAKNGTCSFYAYASLYVIAKNKRVTLAIIGVKNSDTNVAIISYLLSKVNSLNLKIKRLYLDRGFYSSSVIRWLKALDIPFIMPAIRNGKTGGINQYLKGQKRFGIETSYRLKNLCRIRTTTKNPLIRLLYVGISFLLVNIWIYILWTKISKPRRGGRLVYHYLFTLKQMLGFLANFVNRIYEVREIVYIPDG